MFNVYMDGQDDSLIMSDPIVIQNNILTLASDFLNKKESGVNKKREEEVATKVRYIDDRWNKIYLLYSSINGESDPTYGLLSKKHLSTIIDLEHIIISYDKANENFKNTKFNGSKISWTDLCLIDEDPKLDPRNGKPECLAKSYASPVNQFEQIFVN